jgi:YD repeat-containing protein
MRRGPGDDRPDARGAARVRVRVRPGGQPAVRADRHGRDGVDLHEPEPAAGAGGWRGAAASRHGERAGDGDDAGGAGGGVECERVQGGLPVVPGTNVFTVTATDASGNVATAQYEVDVTNAPKTFTYDANGNLTADGTRTFEWDARNQLVAVTVGTHRASSATTGCSDVCDRSRRRAASSSPTRVLWCETVICEERAADGVTVTRRPFGLGEQVTDRRATSRRIISEACARSLTPPACCSRGTRSTRGGGGPARPGTTVASVRTATPTLATC